MAAVHDVRLLLVDDEETLVEYLSKRLLREGFTVRATTSGEEAVRVATDEDFDVAIVDIKMPGMDGVETQKRLKQVRPYIQIIVLTGHGSLETALESGKQDAFLYLPKPADHDELVKAITDAAEKKLEITQAKFMEEVEAVVSSYGSPRAIRAAMDELRKKYGLER